MLQKEGLGQYRMKEKEVYVGSLNRTLKKTLVYSLLFYCQLPPER